jgi:hypothetical protein
MSTSHSRFVPTPPVALVVRMLLGALFLSTATANLQAATPPDPQVAVDSYRRQDWTGKGTYHRLGLFREQENALGQYAVTGEEAVVQEPLASPSVIQRLSDYVSVEGHANTMLFRSDNIFNTEQNAIEESQYAEFLGASLDISKDRFKLTTGFDQSWFRFDDLTDNDFDISTVRQGLSYEQYLFDNRAGITLTPSWQYSELRNRPTDDVILDQWTYALNNELAIFPAPWLVGTLSYDLSYLEASAPGGASDKFKHDFNAGITLIPIEDVKFYVSPSVQYSHEEFEDSNRRDDAWTPTLSITYQPFKCLAVDAVGSYTDSRSNADGADFQAWAGTLFLRLFCRL